MAIDRDIFEALELKLKTLSWVKLVNWKKIRITSSDFRENEVPCIQFYDAGQTITHEHARLNVQWNIAIEIILKSKADGSIDMADLLDKRQEVEQKIGSQPNLGVDGVVHFLYLGNEPDLFTISPFYYTRLDFQAMYYKPYVRDC